MLNQYLRDAVNYAINRTQVIISASAGFGTISETLINPAWPWFNASLNSVYPVNGNVTLAKQFLAKSNYAGQMLPFVYVDLGNNQIVAETVQADLAAAGINTNLISLNFPSYINTAYGGPGGTHWDLLLNQFSESNTRFRDYYTPGETWDLNYINNSQLAQLAAEIAESNSTAAAPYVAQLTQIAQNISVDAPLYWIPFIYASTPMLVGYNVHPSSWYEGGAIWIPQIGAKVWLNTPS